MPNYGTISELKSMLNEQPLLMQGLEYVAQFDPEYFKGREPGFSERVAIAGDDVYASHQVYMTKPLSEARYETHQKYIDIQVVWRGEEIIAVAGTQGLKTLVAYDAEKDIAFFEYFPAKELIVKPGMIAVLYPEDAHAPCLNYKQQQIVAKTVVKVLRTST
jgi:YhcH/YjgK/YiaL family protein